MPYRHFVTLVLALAAPFPALAQDDVEFPAGLRARYSAAGRVVERIDPDILFNWETATPDSRLPEGPFDATWTGQLLVREPGAYRIHAWVQGRLTVRIGDAVALSGESKTPQWLSGEPVPLDFGQQSLVVAYSATAPAASIKLYWSSDHFPLESIPYHLLFHEGPDDSLAQMETGRAEFAAARCNRCHRRAHEPPSPPAPDLTRTVAGMDDGWLLAKIQTPAHGRTDSRMPSFGFSADEAAAIAEFLLATSTPPSLDPLPSPPAKDKQHLSREQEIRTGELLFRTTGCLACHTVGNIGTSGPFTGGTLDAVGTKRSPEWLATWLAAPEKLNADHCMPVFPLEPSERRALALYLAQLLSTASETKQVPAADSPESSVPAATDTAGGEPPALSKTHAAEIIEQGRRLVAEARCAACHHINGNDAETAALPDLAQPPADWANSCLAAEPLREKRRPAYPAVDREAIIAFLATRQGQPSAESRFERGRRVLEERNCLACHERDQSKGIVAIAGRLSRIDSDLQGQSEALIPPALTAVGDKLRDDALAAAVDGAPKTVRLPWLRVRMPRFHHSAEEKDALLFHLIEHDRIPAGFEERVPVTRAAPSAAPGASTADHPVDAKPAETAGDESAALVAGHTLVGPRGFGCIACHVIGKYVPPNVALGTRGSNLAHLGKRMRREFYMRWTRSPLRIVPGMEMPSYERPIPGILGDDVDRQLAVTWDALNHPRFEPPTDPSVVEQLLTVRPGEPPGIVRDVFTNPRDNGGGYVPRALAVGFNNGHCILFDLDTGALRQWTLGEFARQRTQGKSWFWDLAGVHLVAGIGQRSDFALQPLSDPGATPIEPATIDGAATRLIDYRQSNGRVEFRYELFFNIANTLHRLQVRETVAPLDADSASEGSGWERRVEFSNIPVGYRVLWRRPAPKHAIGSAAIEAVQSDGSPATLIATGSQEPRDEFLPLETTGDTANVRLVGTTTLKVPPLRPIEKPDQLASLQNIDTVPGFDGIRLPLNTSIMPTAITFRPDGTLAFTSLKGHVYAARDTDGDGTPDELYLLEQGLAAPYGIIPDGDDLIVAHKPELLRLRDTDGDGRADLRTVLASGWGYTSNYHDWTCGIVRDPQGRLYVGLGSDYSQTKRPPESSRWRGAVLQIAPDGAATPVGYSMRYPTGLAIDAGGHVFATDNQGVQNTFNEINHVRDGRHFGVPSRHEPHPDTPETPPAIKIPHPWTRSVNGLVILPDSFPVPALQGHGIACEYNERFLVRFTLQEVGGEFQGAVYPFSRTDAGSSPSNFLGPLCAAVAPNGDLYIGSISDSGWVGGRNTGEIVRLFPQADLPNGIREIRAIRDGFEVDFFGPIDREEAARPANYEISGYTRVWKGAYYTPDSGRHSLTVQQIGVLPDGRSVRLHVDGLRPGYLYDLTCRSNINGGQGELWPATGHYTLNRVPEE